MPSHDGVQVQVHQQEAALRRKSRAGSSPTRRRRSRDQGEVGAPAVWVSPDWATHPIIESFYGHARRARASSFYEVMCSPMNATATTTLGESCCSYKATDEEDDSQRLNNRRLFGSFAYSCTTDTSEEAADSPLYARHAAMGVSGDSSVCSSSGFAQWNRMRHTMNLNGGLVPVPPDHHFTSDRASLLENPQGGGELTRLSLSPTSSSDVDSLDRPHSPPTSARLRAKLQESLQDMDTRIAEEHKRLNQARRSARKSMKHQAAPANVMWSLLCGARTNGASQADGLAFLTEKLGMAVSHRALNQLQRHRRHVRGILQIVTAHNPDLELTERQLDSFEAADAMLANDIKYTVLCQQLKLLVTSATQRRHAVAQAKLHNGNDCFEKPHVKSVMLSKLLEAVSWYRLVQRNAREEAASTSVGVASASDSSVSSAPSSGGLQELQVDKILDVLAGEEFYSDFNESMCQSDWWEVAQAHFENLIFSSRNSRICQWVLQLSKDVAAVSYEELEENERGGLRSRTNSTLGYHSNTTQQASWTKDPPPEQILDFLERLTSRVRREFDVPADVSKSLDVFIQRTVFPRIAVLCFNQRATRDCQRKDKLWRKKCVELGGLPMENLGVSPELVDKIRSSLPSHRIRGPSNGSNSPCQRRVFLVRAIEAFNSMESVVPCDLLDELMHGVVILHHEAALVLGTTQFSVETFFPLLAYVLVHCRLPTIHAQLHLLENFAITADNANGEESYYVYCVHAAVEYVCNTAGLGVNANPGSTVSSTSSAVSTPGGSPVVPMSVSPPKNHAAFSLELELETELEVKVVGSPSREQPETTGSYQAGAAPESSNECS
ncbi:cleavage induced hypothetical protein [Phytophthora infestans T30-4]|uniref:VPS9 domain-containing protein n=2 Tax=Phytophthora infestans TaxID=4787 RepID=D0NEU6_PHYIT|nr:cleavage induced hypothetical protein [Phytophthora infestans T30-4]EEY56378.1 cleavage induced hypothetical protein [Phytophthora infestans T30-4]KAF4040898.1 Vacuolar sorting protein 9 (VPS9) domain [Phytophthora infestans]KAF4147984.1 Vacuolar sorting protein 9 (VPS9) domain [Phytophthora infestans]|eukprot:XP_002902452.1 cleavage induced hypothetical protein [Phytophthora infestans T30-4]